MGADRLLGQGVVTIVLVITIGSSGIEVEPSAAESGSPPVGTSEMRSATSMPLVTLPKME